MDKKLEQYRADTLGSIGRCISMATRRCMTGLFAGQEYTTAPSRLIEAAKAKGFRVNINCTLFSDADPERVARLLR